MKNAVLKLPSDFSELTEDEMLHITGGKVTVSAWDFIEGTITGLASAGADVIGSVMRGEIDPISAICSSFVYLAGNIVASIIWTFTQVL